MNVLGIIGGLGPMATAYFLELIVRMTDAAKDQEHLPSLTFNLPDIPDRTAHVLDPQKESPVPRLTAAAKQLEKLGCCCIAVPCVTSHCFYEELAASVDIPWINAVDETAAMLKTLGVKKAGILATSGTIATGLFQNALDRAGISWAVPDEAGQQKVMHLIYKNVKAGLPPEMELFYSVSESLRAEGCEMLILGCTELSLIKRDRPIGPGYLDVLEVLARAAVLQCGKPLVPGYELLGKSGTDSREN